MAAFVQTAGFPLMFPFIFLFSPSKTPQGHHHQLAGKPSWTTLAILYTTLGISLAVDCMLYTFGLNFLPVSTYSLISASQLAFNAFFSYLFNGQKFTPFIANSLVLLSFSSTLLVFQSDSEETRRISKSKYIIGFVCTVAASTGMVLFNPLNDVYILKKKVQYKKSLYFGSIGLTNNYIFLDKSRSFFKLILLRPLWPLFSVYHVWKLTWYFINLHGIIYTCKVIFNFLKLITSYLPTRILHVVFYLY